MSNSKETLRLICKAIEDKKGEGLTVLDLRGISSFTDYFVICHGNNSRQNQAISDNVSQTLKKERHLTPAHVEGFENAEWILLDYLDFVVHVFSESARDYFKLEKLWSDAVKMPRAALTA